MAIKGAQDFWVAGTRVYVQRAPIGGVVQPTIDLGVIKETTPNFESTSAQLFDTDGGHKVLADEALVQFVESYSINCANFNNNNLALLFGATPAVDFTQSATPVTDVVHYAHPGELVKIVDASGNAVFNITSIQAVTGPSGTPAYVLNTDYEIVDLVRGLIRMKAGGAFAAAGNIEIDYTKVALSGKRLVYPQSQAAAVRAKAWLILGREANQNQHVREMDVSILPDSVNFTADDFSDFTLKFTVLNDTTNPTAPAGRLLFFKGTLPTQS